MKRVLQRCLQYYLSMAACICLLLCVYFFSCGLAGADTKTELGNKQVKITFESTNTTLALRIITETPFVAEVFSLEKPARIVVNAVGLKLKSYKSTRIAKTKLLKSFQMGVYPGKVRFVLELNSANIPEYSTTQEGSEFLLKIREQEELSALKAQPQMLQVGSETAAPESGPTIMATAAAKPMESASEEEQNEKSPEQKVSEEQEQKAPEETATPYVATAAEAVEKGITPEASPTPTAFVEEVRTLKSILFENGKEAVLRLVMSKEASFKLSKEKELYILSLSDCAVAGQHLLLPHYPQEAFPGIKVVKAYIEDPNIVIRIFVERGVRLNAFRDGTEIKVLVERKSL